MDKAEMEDRRGNGDEDKGDEDKAQNEMDRLWTRFGGDRAWATRARRGRPARETPPRRGTRTIQEAARGQGAPDSAPETPAGPRGGDGGHLKRPYRCLQSIRHSMHLFSLRLEFFNNGQHP